MGSILRLVLILASLVAFPDAMAADSGGGIFVDAAYGKTTGGQPSTAEYRY